MKRLFFIISQFAIAFSLSAQVQKEIKPEIRHVTVFPDRAQVDHETSLSIAPGRTVYKLTGLSPYIDPQSIQVKGLGEFTILSVNQQNNFLQNLEESPEIKNITDQIEALQAKTEDEKAAIEVLNEKLEFLRANRAMLAKETTSTAEHIKGVIDLYTSNMEDIAKARLKRDRQVKEYEKQINALQQQIASRRQKLELPSGEISVAVASEKQLSAKLLVSYVVTNAGWYPSYDIRVEDIKNPVSIAYKANVYQNTGNDWNNVKLSFSNATPSVSGNVPELYPWFIDFYSRPQPVLRERMSVKKEAEAPSAVAVQDISAFSVASGPEVQKQTGETTVSFDVNVPYSIPSDGQMQTVEIQRIQSPAGYRYVTIPRKSPVAYLTANINDWAGLSLQSGEATLYFENSFVGKSYLNVNQLTDTLTLSLGTDNSILVKREKRKDFTSRKVLGSNRTETSSYLITLRNNKAVPVSITLKDQVPVSSNSAITVQTEELSGGKFDNQTGYVTWDLNIKPGETKEIILTYSVKYPKDKNIILD
jgi:uncharacterized protein (TIGR02231 family)